MSFKDHYAILEIEPAASIDDIKKAYRRLALQFHPDKKPGDPYAAAQFAAIKEAYEVLTHPSRKEQYLQQRWYAQSMGSKKSSLIVTPENLLKEVLQLEKYVSKLDVFRMDKQGLHDHIAVLLDNDTIQQLNVFKDEEVNDRIVAVLINCIKLLPIHLLRSLYKQLTRIQLSGSMKKSLAQFLANSEKAHQRDHYKIWVIVLVVIGLCLLIIFIA